jgi:hypothetical protein
MHFAICARDQVAMLISGQVRTGTADAALCDAAIAAAAAQLPAMKLQDLTTLLFSLGKVSTWPHSQSVVAAERESVLVATAVLDGPPSAAKAPTQVCWRAAAELLR